MNAKYLAIGINAAGFYAMEALRDYDPDGVIVAVNSEEHLPYKRTKINKHFYPAGLDIKKIQLADPSWYENKSIILMNNTSVTSIDISNKTAELDHGEKIAWEKLLFSTGAESYCPDADVLIRALSIRSYNDALMVRDIIKISDSCLVYGLGIEAIETAAQLSESGLHVTLTGRGKGLLERYFSLPVSSMVEKLFSARDVKIIYNTEISSLKSIPSKDRVSDTAGVTAISENGVKSDYDFLLYSTGISPRIELAKACGIHTDCGILVNSSMETSVSDVYAAGDCTQSESGIITDHWHAAQDQGRTAAANMAGLSSIWPVKRYRLKVELFGNYYFSMRSFKEKMPDILKVEESVLSSGAYRLFYYKGDHLHGVEMVNDKSRAKMYEQAVNEEWERDKVSDKIKG